MCLNENLLEYDTDCRLCSQVEAKQSEYELFWDACKYVGSAYLCVLILEFLFPSKNTNCQKEHNSRQLKRKPIIVENRLLRTNDKDSASRTLLPVLFLGVPCSCRNASKQESSKSSCASG